ncbi:MAG: guanylate kinase [bacterium]|nr:guanylate kinase [bacterium]
MTRKGHLFVISAPSGTGKSTLINRAVDEISDMWHSVSATTRAPRNYEKEGVHYFFMGRADFQKKIEEGHFLEWARVHDEYYGTPVQEVDRRLEAGVDVIMDLDVQGALQLKERRPGARLIFIMPPSIESLRERLKGRNTESEEKISARIAEAKREITQRDHYDHVIVNNVLEDAYRELAGVILGIREEAEEPRS